MSVRYPPYVAAALSDGEHNLLFVPEPDRDARRSMLLAHIPPIAVLASAIVLASSDGPRGSIRDILMVWCSIALIIALFVHWIRACRTSYAITSHRVIRFVSDRLAEDLLLADCHKSFTLDYRQSTSLIFRGIARFMSLRPMVRLERKVPLPMTFARFLIGSDVHGLRIGGPGRDLPISEILEITTHAWLAAQSTSPPPMTALPRF